MARKSIVKSYSTATVEKRIEIILDNYSVFDRMLDGFERSIFLVIRTEREEKRNRERCDLGIRVQTSNISDITGDTASNEADLERAIHEGDWMSAIKGAINLEKHRREIETVHMMRRDYELVTEQFGCLKPRQYRLLERYLGGEEDPLDIAEDIGITVEALRSRVYRYRVRVKENALYHMDILQQCA